MNRTRRNYQSGFTLVEALLAGLVLAMAAGVLGTSLRQAHSSMQQAGDYQRAAELLGDVLTKVDLLGPAKALQDGLTEGQFTGADSRFSWQLRILSRPLGHLYEVTATVNWTDSRGSQSVQAQTLLNDPPGSRNPNLEWDSL